MVSLLQAPNGQYTITIPKDVIEATGWKKGDSLYVGKNKGEDSAFIEKNLEIEEKKKEKKKK